MSKVALKAVSPPAPLSLQFPFLSSTAIDWYELLRNNHYLPRGSAFDWQTRTYFCPVSKLACSFFIFFELFVLNFKDQIPNGSTSSSLVL